MRVANQEEKYRNQDWIPIAWIFRYSVVDAWRWMV